MALGVIGRKLGMTRVFTKEGISTPVTVIEVEPNRITQIKNEATDGYNAVQVTTGQKHANRINKPQTGHFVKAKVGTGRGLWEFRFDDEQIGNYEVGNEIKADIFEQHQMVDVIGTTIGKGFTGTIKRHNFSAQRNSHGNSLSHRVPGSIGQNQTPGRVFKGKKMAGHVGAVRRTVQNLEIIRVDSERNLLLIKGAVPGAKGSDVIVRPSIKTKS